MKQSELAGIILGTTLSALNASETFINASKEIQNFGVESMFDTKMSSISTPKALPNIPKNTKATPNTPELNGSSTLEENSTSSSISLNATPLSALKEQNHILKELNLTKSARCGVALDDKNQSNANPVMDDEQPLQ